MAAPVTLCYTLFLNKQQCFHWSLTSIQQMFLFQVLRSLWLLCILLCKTTGLKQVPVLYLAVLTHDSSQRGLFMSEQDRVQHFCRWPITGWARCLLQRSDYSPLLNVSSPQWMRYDSHWHDVPSSPHFTHCKLHLFPISGGISPINYFSHTLSPSAGSFKM